MFLWALFLYLWLTTQFEPMLKFINVFLWVMCWSSFTHAQQVFSDKNNPSDFAEDPDDIELVTTDIDLFWKYYDQQVQDTTKNYFEHYLEEGSIGVQGYIPERIESAEALKELVLSETNYYDNIRSSSYKALAFKKQIKAACYALEYWYPEATYPPVYFLIGRTTSGGTANENGLMIALEVYADSNIKTNYGRPSLDIEILPNVVVHELIHFIQEDDENDQTLLKKCIREGSADFIAELISGEKVKLANGPNVYPYGDAHEKELWLEFKDAYDATERAPWLYSTTEDKRPQNLGYWMGYKIVESYYEQADDKKEAIKEILSIKDYKAFLVKSRYAEQFK